MTFIVTLSLLVTTPCVFEQSAGRFQVLSGFPGLFLQKDLVLLAAPLVLVESIVVAGCDQLATLD